MSSLNIKAVDETKYDGLAIGEVMLRLDPSPVPSRCARTLDVYHGGGETNVCEGLSACFGLRCAVVTALVDDGIGQNINRQIQEAGVDTSHIIWFNTNSEGKFSTDAKGSLHNGINFTYAGKGVYPAVTEYYRAHTPIREIGPGDVDWDYLFGELGVRWFHTGGIYTLISDSAAEVALEAVQAAQKHGTIVAFDLNYRSKMEPNKDRARGINKSIMNHVDVVVGNQGDFDDALGYQTAAVDKDADFDVWLQAYTETLKKVAGDYPNLKFIGTQLRGALSADRINWSAILYDVVDDKMYQATPRENIEIADRVGGGDSYAAGVAAAFMKGHDAQTAVEWGAAHGILVQETPGDTTMVNQHEVENEVARAQKGGGVSVLR